MTPWELNAKKNWSEGWITGFLAATYLFTGRRKKYEELRDEWLGPRASSTDAGESP